MPNFDIFPSCALPPLECGFGVSPIQAARSRADLKFDASNTVAAIALDVIGPIPGMVCKRRATASSFAATECSGPLGRKFQVMFEIPDLFDAGRSIYPCLTVVAKHYNAIRIPDRADWAKASSTTMFATASAAT